MPSAAILSADSVVIRIRCREHEAYYAITKGMIANWIRDFPAIDVCAEFRGMVAWADCTPAKRWTLADAPAGVQRWLNRQNERPPVDYAKRPILPLSKADRWSFFRQVFPDMPHEAAIRACSTAAEFAEYRQKRAALADADQVQRAARASDRGHSNGAAAVSVLVADAVANIGGVDATHIEPEPDDDEPRRDPYRKREDLAPGQEEANAAYFAKAREAVDRGIERPAPPATPATFATPHGHAPAPCSRCSNVAAPNFKSYPSTVA